MSGGIISLHSQLLHRFLQNLMESFQAHITDKSALLGTQQITCTTDIQILHSNTEPTT